MGQKLRLLIPFSGAMNAAEEFLNSIMADCTAVRNPKVAFVMDQKGQNSAVAGIYFRGYVVGDPLSALGDLMRHHPTMRAEQKSGLPVPIVRRPVDYFKVSF